MPRANPSLIGGASRGRDDGLAVVLSTVIALLSVFVVDRCFGKSRVAETACGIRRLGKPTLPPTRIDADEVQYKTLREPG